jgi:predicted nucleic acid-binding protein
MRVLLDTNVVLDVLLNRSPWVAEAKAIWQANDEGQMTGYITATTITDIFYVARRMAGLNIARTAVQTCLTAFEICNVDRPTLERASMLMDGDFEDNLQIACAEAYGLEAIVTRDPAGFHATNIPILSPAEIAPKI